MDRQKNIGIIELSSMSKKRSGAISCCMITRDEAQVVGDAIESVKGLAEEIVVVDTGSVDGTPEIAESLGARVFKREWRNDFSDARNFSISKARYGWILILDADEILSEKDHTRIRDLVKEDPDAAFMFDQWTYTDDSDTFGWRKTGDDDSMSRGMLGLFPSQQVRLFKNDKDIRYSGEVHEDVERSLTGKSTPIYKAEGVIIHHYGRMKDSDRIERKYRMYLSLGEKKLTANPGNTKYIFELAAQLLGLGHSAEALVQIERGLELNPQSWEFLNLKGLIYLNQGKNPEAVEQLRTALALQKGKVDLYNNLGVALIENRDPAGAIEVLKAGIDLDGNNANILRNSAAAHLQTNDLTAARDLIEKSLDIDPFMSQSHVIYAEILWKQGYGDMAVDTLEKIRFIKGTDLKVYLKSVYLYSQMQMVDRASEVVNRALDEYPENEGLFYLSGKVHEMKGELESARAIYSELLTRKPNDSEILNSLGCIYEKRGDYQEALQKFRKSFKLSPANMQIEVNLGIVMGKLDMDDEAEFRLRAVIDRDSGNTSALNALGCFLSQRDRFTEAIDLFRRAIELDPDDIRFYLNLGLVCEKMNMPVKAAEIYEKATIIDPSSVPLVKVRLQHIRETVS